MHSTEINYSALNWNEINCISLKSTALRWNTLHSMYVIETQILWCTISLHFSVLQTWLDFSHETTVAAVAVAHQSPSFSTLRHVAREVFNNNNIWMKWTTIQFAFSGNVSNTFARHDKFISISNQHCLSRLSSKWLRDPHHHCCSCRPSDNCPWRPLLAHCSTIFLNTEIEIKNKDHLVWQLPQAATTCLNCWCFKAKSRMCSVHWFFPN